MLRLSSVSVEAVLKRGFAWVRNQDGQTVYSTAEAAAAAGLNLTFYDGSFNCGVPSAVNTAPAVKPAKTAARTRKKDDLQTDLFDF